LPYKVVSKNSAINMNFIIVRFISQRKHRPDSLPVAIP
jgi:hypothetical protein